MKNFLLFNFLLIVFLLSLSPALSITSSVGEDEQSLLDFDSGRVEYAYNGNYSYSDSWDFSDSETYSSLENYEIYFPDSLNITIWYDVWWTEYDYENDEFVDYYGYAFLNEDDPNYGNSSSNPDYWNLVDFDPLETVNDSIYSLYDAHQIQEWSYWNELDLYDWDTNDWIGMSWTFDWEIIVYDSPEHVGDLTYADYWILYEVSDIEVHSIGSWYELEVEYNESWTYDSAGSFSYWYKYDALVEGYQVNLSLNTLNFNYLAAVESTVTYQEYEFFEEDYFWDYLWQTQVFAPINLTLKGHFFKQGDLIPQEFLPEWLQSEYETEEGYYSDTYSSSGTFSSISTFQSHFHAFQTQTFPESYMIWENTEEGTLIAYEETTGNSKALDYKYDASDHSFIIEDAIKYRGYPELYEESSSYSYSWSEDVIGSISSDYLNEYWQYETEANDNGEINWKDDIQDYSVEFAFNEPILINNEILVNWSITYKEFPIWWVSEDTYESFMQTNDITYNYTMSLEPDTGVSVLGSTFSLGTFDDREAFQGLGLAIVQTSESLSTAALTQEDSYIRSKATTTLDLNLGDVSIASIDFGGEKSNYALHTLPGDETYQANVESLNLIHINDNNNNRTIFSETSERIGSFLADTYKNQSFDYDYDRILLITSYSTWNGFGITHDPAYSAVAALSTSKNNNNNSDTSAPIPGFELTISILTFVAIVLPLRKKRL
ncbi:MAG: hypothetical protein ACTSW1_17050 [Candidatus Hodarchaeales archaeon]